MKVLITDDLANEGVEVLQEAGLEVELRTKTQPEELLALVPNFECLIIRSASKVTPEVIEAAQNLKVIGRAGKGYDNVDTDAASQYGIPVMIAPEGNTRNIAEHTVNLMHNVSRKVLQAYHELKNGTWYKKRFKGVELTGKTVGLIGCGWIGKDVARIIHHGYQMKVLGYDPIANFNTEIQPVTMDELLERSDYVSLHIPKMDAPVIGEAELRKMKDTAYLINASRGGNVDEEALYEALTKGWIAGAAFDVFETEAKDGEGFHNRLLDLDNFVASPHLGASTAEGQAKTAVEIAERVVAYLNTQDACDAVNYEGLRKSA